MSRIRADRYTNRLGTGAPTFSNGVNIIGNVGVGTTVPTSNLTVKGDMNVTGTVSVGGTLTYEDVTNIDSVGIITAQSGIHIDDSIVHLGDTNTKIRFPAADTITVETVGTERLRITSAGDMGLGVTDATILDDSGFRELVIGGATEGGAIHLQDADGNVKFGAFTSDASNAAFIRTITNHPIVFRTNNTERLRITTNAESEVELYCGATDGNYATVRGKYSSSNQYNRSEIRFGVEANATGSGFLALATGTNSATERLRIASDGKVGINETSPSRAISINGSINLASGSRIESYSSGGNLIIQGGSTYPGGHIRMYGGSGDDMITFNTSGGSASSIERMRITSSGLVGVNDSTTGWAESFQVTSSTAYNQYGIAIKIQSNSGYLLRFGNGTNNPCGSVSSSGGNSTSYNTSWSDSRRKKNIETWNEEVLPHFKSLEPKKFNFIHEDDGTVKTKGYTAQDNVDKFPEAYPLLDDTDIDEKRYMFNPSGMVIYLMKALQEEIAKREAIEQRLTDAGL
tara:strand:- start:8612 stop:10159 length:1548 start_codon:yes stop_codon:yes gene_type:complete